MYRVKRRLLGRPLTTERVTDEKLSNRTALGVLASDCISSSAYGSEEMLRVLVPVVGAAAFTMVMPVTGAILLVLLLLTLCYSDVVTIYTRAGGSYVVARENFGPNVAQVAAVALLVDYVVTVAVQVSAGTSALVSLAHLVGNGWTGLDHLQVPVSLLVIVLLGYGNLRGVREAGRMFALPAYLFAAAMGLVFLVAAVRGLRGELPHADLHAPGVVPLGTPGDGWLYGASLFIVLRSFANGGSSLTGLEAISNGISAFREPQGRNARHTLIAMSCVLAVLVLGVSALAHFTHAVPYTDGTPTVIAQEARLAFGNGTVGTIGLVFVQLATALVLYTGANTPFTGFPYLASFVAQDRFLPRVLTRRGHRLAFSNGIVTLCALSLALLLGTGATWTSWWPSTRSACSPPSPWRGPASPPTTCAARASAPGEDHGQRPRGDRLRRRGADLRRHEIHRRRLAGRRGLPPRGLGTDPDQPRVPARGRRPGAAARGRGPAAHAPPPGVRPGRDAGPRRAEGPAVCPRAAARQRERRALRHRRGARTPLSALWASTSATSVELELVACPDRRLRHAMRELAVRTTQDGDTSLTVLVPRRMYANALGKLLHRGTGENMSRALEQLPHVAVTILPFNASHAMQALERDHLPDMD